MGNALRGILSRLRCGPMPMLAPGNDHHEPDDGLTEAPREEEEENDEDFAGPPELISSEEEDEQVFLKMRVVDFYPNGTPASRALVEWARAVGFEVVHDTNPDHNTADDDDLLPDGVPGNATLLRHHSAFNSSLV